MNKQHIEIAKIIKNGTFIGLKYQNKDSFSFEEVDDLIKIVYNKLLKRIANELADCLEREDKQSEDSNHTCKITESSLCWSCNRTMFNRKTFIKMCGVK